MHGVKISDDLELSSSRSDEAFSACGDKILKVPNHHPEFTEIDLQGADISGSLYLSHAKADRVNLHHINVGGSLWVDHMGAISKLDIEFSKIVALLDLSCKIFGRKQ